MLKRLRKWLAAFDFRFGKVKCDICGQWGISNPNYKGCDGKAFVHVSYYGTSYVHPEHIIRHILASHADSDEAKNVGRIGC